MNEMRIPFSVFDFFVYFTPGATLVLILFFSFWTDPTMRLSDAWKNLSNIGELRFGVYLALAIFSYLVGHGVAALGSWTLETVLVGRVFGRPSENLFKSASSRGLFKGYKRSYSQRFISEFERTFRELFGEGYGAEDTFMICHSVVKEKCENTFSRLNIFITQYDLARNLATVFFIGSPILAAGGVLHGDWYLVSGALLSALFFILMLARYLKFYRRYSDEVYRSFFAFAVLMMTERRIDEKSGPHH